MSAGLLSNALVAHFPGSPGTHTVADPLIEILTSRTAKRNAAVTLALLIVAERVAFVFVGTRLRSDALPYTSDVLALLAAAFQVIKVAYGAKANPFPAAIDYLVHQHAPEPPYCPASYAWRVLALQLVTRAFVNRRPVELVGYSMDGLHACT